MSLTQKVAEDSDTGCWVWQRSKTHDGYGRLRVQGKLVYAHRHYYEQLVGPIPEGLQLDHLCRNRSCVNPDHLDPVTKHVNDLRGNSPSAINARKTHCIHKHPFTPENIYWWRGGRICRECGRIRESNRIRQRKVG